MNIIDTGLPEVKVVEPRVFTDARGFFFESWNVEAFAAAGITDGFVQDNHSRSSKGVLRGLHYQVVQPQGKLIRVIAGRIFDVAVDLRRASPRFGCWTGVELSARNKHMLWVPPGFAHGFLSLEDDTDVLYKCTALFAPEYERSVSWSDTQLGIAWPLEDIGTPLVSAKDADAASLEQANAYP